MRKHALAAMVLTLGMTALPAEPPDVSPAEHLRSLDPPQFKTGHTLPPLTRWGWGVPFDTNVELAERWGYAVEYGECNMKRLSNLDDPNSEDSRLLALCNADSSRYQLSILSIHTMPKDSNHFPPDAWARDADGKPMGGKQQSLDGTSWNQNLILSPAAPDAVWEEAARQIAEPIRLLRQRCKIAVILNGGEYGLGVLGFAQQHWEKDPAILKAKGDTPWFDYISSRKANAETIIGNAVRKAAPDRSLYIYYTAGGDIANNVNERWKVWAFGWKWMKGVSDLPSNEIYYNHFNTRWTGDRDMLSMALNATAAEIADGQKLSYNWVNGGWPRKGLEACLGDLERYEGFLKCYYTAGMTGGVAGYFAYPLGGFAAKFPKDAPPHWLSQIVVMSRVHALFSNMEPYLRDGDLLPGQGLNRFSKNRPAYEFPNREGDKDKRVLARKLRGKAEWLITAWAADGKEGAVTVDIPDLGAVTLLARPRGTVYLARQTPALRQMDEEVVLVKDGKPMATIVVPADDIPLDDNNYGGGVAHLAAKEFAEHVKLATGAALPIVTDKDNPTGTLLLIGDSRLSREDGVTIDILPPEGFRVVTCERGLAIVGSKASPGNRGTLFGVYDFLERYLGVRWYYPGEDGRVVPKRPSLAVASTDYSDAPLRTERTMYPWTAPGMPAGTDFKLHELRSRGGVSTPVKIACHTPTNFGIHFAEHPDCFELQADGKRNPSMPCYGNPKTAELFIQDLERFYAKGDGAPWKRDNGQLWQPPTAAQISVSPPDAPVECRCEHCRKLLDGSAPQLGRASRLLATYVGRVANEAAKRWPEKKVFYLPYSNYTLPPAGMKLPDNVTIGLCLMLGAANDKEPQVAARHDAMIKGWNEIARGSKAKLWEYYCWPTDDTALPFQYPHVLKAFQQRHRTDIAGSFINGGYDPAGLPGEQWASRPWTLYCWFRLLWNPDFDVDAALKEHLALMYGPAEKPMAAIYRSLIGRWENTRWTSVPNDHHVGPKLINEETMPPQEVANLKRLLAEARAAVPETSVERRRVELLAKSLELFFQESDSYHGGAKVPTLNVLKIGGAPTLDGKLDEPCWRDAEKQTFKKGRPEDPDPQPGKTASFVQAVWNERGVTFGFSFEEGEKAGALLTKCSARNQSGLWWDDCVETFLDPAGRRTDYFQVIANSFPALFARSTADTEWSPKSIKAAVWKGPDRWTLELSIPFDELGKVEEPKVGAVWYANFIRNRPDAKGHPWFQRWNSLGRPSNLDFSAFGKLRFVE